MLTMFYAAAEHEAEAEAAINPFVIGGAALGILLFLLFVLVTFGGGREHT